MQGTLGRRSRVESALARYPQDQLVTTIRGAVKNNQTDKAAARAELQHYPSVALALLAAR